jgi:hypothetical protein
MRSLSTLHELNSGAKELIWQTIRTEREVFSKCSFERVSDLRIVNGRISVREKTYKPPESPLTQINPKCIVLRLWAWRTIRYEPTSSGSMCRSHNRTVLGSSPSGPTISFLLFSVSCPSIHRL